MALNIKNPEVEALADEVARLGDQTKTVAIRQAVLARRRVLIWSGGEDRGARLTRLLETEIWPTVPSEQVGRSLTRQEEADLLGFGPDGA